MDSLKEKLLSLLPQDVYDRVTGRDLAQIDALHDDIKQILFCGTDEECGEALADIRARERLQNVTLLGPSAREYIYDWRAMYPQNQE